MKKIALILVAVMLLTMLASCDVVDQFLNPDQGGEQGGASTPGDGGTTDPGTGDTGTPDDENPGTDNENPGTDDSGNTVLPSDTITVTAVRGVNEQIYISLTPDEGLTTV